MFDIALLTSSLRLSTPLTFAALGGLFSERAGIVNIALEGLMLFGAFAAAVATHYTGNPWFGLLCGCFASVTVAMLHGIFCIFFEGDQIISGAAINILAIGVPPVLSNALFGTSSITPALSSTIPSLSPGFLAQIPVFGQIFSQVSVLVWLGIAAIFGAHFVLRKTAFGLRLNASGENPAMLDLAGVSVTAYRFYGLLICGILTGIGGAYLSIAHGTQFIINMTAGRGFIALAALIIANWKPKNILYIALALGFMDALQIRLQNQGFIPSEIIQIFPYLLTIIMLIGLIGKPKPPSGLGIPYKLGKK